VARRALTAGATYCPHFLGGGIGLVASAHLLAAAGGPGLLEIDANPNPLRDAFVPAGQPVTDGRFPLLDAPGLGIEEIPADLTPYRSLQLDRNA
jgi:L-alanine-DL-glutamate epimerase-like enolase superfamily enzyme